MNQKALQILRTLDVEAARADSVFQVARTLVDLPDDDMTVLAILHKTRLLLSPQLFTEAEKQESKNWLLERHHTIPHRVQ